MACQGANALGPHRIALVWHRGRSDLAAPERLLDLAEALQQPDVAPELRGAGADTRQDRENSMIDLPRVGLPNHVVRPGEAEPRRQALVQRIDLGSVAEQFEERVLRPRGASRSAEAQLSQHGVDLLEIQKKVLQPLQYFVVVEETAAANDMSKHRAHTTKYEDLCM